MGINDEDHIPDVDRIETLLGRFKPQPTFRLHQKVASAPWHSSTYPKAKVFSPRQRTARYLSWGFALLVIILFIGVISFVPPVRAIARQIIFSFISAPSSQIELQVTPASPGELFNLNDPANFILTVEQSQKQAGFVVAQITPVPAGLRLVGARFEESYNAVILFYQADGYTLFLTQRARGKGQDVFTIGPDARVERVTVAGNQAEYVQGGWKVISTQPTRAAKTPVSSLSVTAVWDATLPQSTLRWQTGNMVFELRLVGEGAPSQTDLIKWANELK
jgi:hypothetical protein